MHYMIISIFYYAANKIENKTTERSLIYLLIISLCITNDALLLYM